MQTNDLHFEYPAELVATERKKNSRVMWVDQGERPREISPQAVLNEMRPEDTLVVNTTKVIPARVFSASGLEILFIEELSANQWRVLCPARKWPKREALVLPGDIRLELVERGLPQVVQASAKIDSDYFENYGDWPLPPYIQEARGERKSRSADSEMYQTDWAKDLGSLAAPTASFHFSKEDLKKVAGRGASVCEITLHVGLGTFLPIHSESLVDHKMHFEHVEVPAPTWEQVQKTRSQGGRVWALGSTVTRALESRALGLLQDTESGAAGPTDLFIRPGFEFRCVDVLMTNFHQPKTTLLAMVMAFAGIEPVRKGYGWAVDRKFRLFSYGDLSVWTK